MQQVFHEVRQTARFLIDDRQRAPPFFVGAHTAQHERLGKHANLRQRRTQLVRDAGDEIRTQARELGFAPQLHECGADQYGRQRQQAENHGKARPRQSADDELVRDRGAQRRLGVQIAHVPPDGVVRRER